MENYRILLTPCKPDDLPYLWDVCCKDLDAAREQATAYLVMTRGTCKSATVFSQWKSPLSWRQAIPPIYYEFNL